MPTDFAPGPVFVVGLWRSGTSLLHALLNQHPDVGLMYEADLALLSPLFSPCHKSNWPLKWDTWNWAPTRHQMQIDSIPSELADLRSACEAVYKQYAKRKGASIWGEKSPNYHGRLSALARIFPHSRFVIIWRSPMGIYSSILRAQKHSPFLDRRGILLRALLGCKRMKQECDKLVKRDVPVHQLRYEDLTVDTESTMRALCSFLQVPFDVRVTSLNGADRTAVWRGDHQALVRSTQVIPGTEQEDVVPPVVRAKILRYHADWSRTYGPAWPLYSSVAGQRKGPSRAELVLDHANYWLLRTLDWTTRIAFCFAPLKLWQAYRKIKYRGMTVNDFVLSPREKP